MPEQPSAHGARGPVGRWLDDASAQIDKVREAWASLVAAIWKRGHD